MKGFIKRAILICLAAITILCANTGCGRVSFNELGIPSEQRFSDGIFARTAWDMIVWDNKLYVGGGDYNDNTGPTDVWCYDLASKTWSNSGRVEDESVMRFCVIGDKLIAPGIDPKGVDWENGEDYSGNYYALESGTWKTYSVLPNAIHNFDIVEHGGKIFAGLGIKSGSRAVACSSDGGKTFVQLKFIKDGKEVDTSGSSTIRVYETFVHKDQVFALLRYGKGTAHYELYRYDGEKMTFFSDWLGKFYGGQPTFNLFSGKATFKDRTFFTIGKLFVTDDMDTLTCIPFDDKIVICDAFVRNEKLYLLGVHKTESGCRISVWENASGKNDDFKEIFYFNYVIPVLSFAYDGENFYFGAGSRTTEHEKNGMILSVKYKI